MLSTLSCIWILSSHSHFFILLFIICPILATCTYLITENY